MRPLQLDFSHQGNYLEKRGEIERANHLATSIKRNNEVQRWIETYFPANAYDAKSSMGEILSFLADNDQSKQFRHYVTALCSQKDENIVAFCETFLPNYFVFSVLAMIKNKLDPAMDKQTYKFHKKLSSWSHHLEKSSE